MLRHSVFDQTYHTILLLSYHIIVVSANYVSFEPVQSKRVTNMAGTEIEITDPGDL